jgi:hypothetical protein
MIGKAALGYGAKATSWCTEVLFPATATGAFTTANPGVDHASITNTDILCIRPDSDHFTKNFMTEYQARAPDFQLLVVPQIEFTIVQMDI